MLHPYIVFSSHDNGSDDKLGYDGRPGGYRHWECSPSFDNKRRCSRYESYCEHDDTHGFDGVPVAGTNHAVNTTTSLQDMAMMIASLQNMIANLERQVQIIDTTTAQAQTPPAVIPGSPASSSSLPTKKRLGELTKFDGTRSHYPSRKLEAMSKLKYDGHLTENDRARLAYLFMRMESDAQFKVRAYYNAVQVQEAYSQNLFIEYLDSVYIDPNEAGRALDRLQNMK